MSSQQTQGWWAFYMALTRVVQIPSGMRREPGPELGPQEPEEQQRVEWGTVQVLYLVEQGQQRVEWGTVPVLCRAEPGLQEPQGAPV